MKRALLAIGILILIAMITLIMPGTATPTPKSAGPRSAVADLTEFSDEKPSKPLRMLFIHHSCGGQLLADRGASDEQASCIYNTHPNGGGLRSRLGTQGYEIHEASYGSMIGEDTDLFHWAIKFRDQMDKVLTCDLNDRFYKDNRRNQIIVFKSCFPNNQFSGAGSEGSADSPELTVANAKAALESLLPEFEKHPKTLFVYVTAPPMAYQSGARSPMWKRLAKKALGRGVSRETELAQSKLARQFNDWVRSRDGWLKDYKHSNVAVFDYYDILTGEGASDFCVYPSGDGSDSHPSAEGNAKAAEQFVPFLNRAVRRAGLTD